MRPLPMSKRTLQQWLFFFFSPFLAEPKFLHYRRNEEQIVQSNLFLITVDINC